MRLNIRLNSLFIVSLSCLAFSSAEIEMKAAGQSPSAQDTVLESSALDQVPVPKTQQAPQYPFELRRTGKSGFAIVDFIIDMEGTVRRARTVATNQTQFGLAAVACVSKWVFAPGIKSGHPVNVHLHVPLVFILNKASTLAVQTAMTEMGNLQTQLEQELSKAAGRKSGVPDLTAPEPDSIDVELRFTTDRKFAVTLGIIKASLVNPDLARASIQKTLAGYDPAQTTAEFLSKSGPALLTLYLSPKS